MESTFGQFLRTQRRLAGISQRELARRVDVDYSYISKLENDRLPPPSAATVIAMADALEISRESFLAVVGKIPTEVEKAIGKSQGAQGFLKDAQLMELSDAEWSKIRAALSRLRDGR